MRKEAMKFAYSAPYGKTRAICGTDYARCVMTYGMRIVECEIEMRFLPRRVCSKLHAILDSAELIVYKGDCASVSSFIVLAFPFPPRASSKKESENLLPISR